MRSFKFGIDFHYKRLDEICQHKGKKVKKSPVNGLLNIAFTRFLVYNKIYYIC